ncbi:hypothetical protein D3C87_1158780 [compost metagenome]
MAGGSEHRLELFDWLRQGMGEKKRIRLTATLGMFVVRLGGDQFQVAGGARAVGQVGVTHQALRYAFAVQMSHRCEGTGHQQFGDTDAKTAGDQFDAEHQAGAVQLRPEPGQLFGEYLRGFAAQRQQLVFDPRRQTVGGRVGSIGQYQRNGFGQIADGLITLFEQPRR